MTALGKILVIINLVFALVTGALIVMVYATRTNYKNSLDQLNKYYAVAQANAKTYAEEARQTKLVADKDKTDLQTKLAAAEKDRDNFRKESEDRQAQLDKATIDSKSSVVTSRAVTEEIERRRKEVQDMQETLAKREQKILALEAESKKILDKYILADIAARSSQDRNTRLVDQVEFLTKELEKLKSGVASKDDRFARKPPPEDVEGVITEMDAKTGLVTISIGSDAGLSKGNTLEVYRLKPEPKYLGTIRLLDVNHHAAVGRPLANNKIAFIQKGDRVASNILGQK